MTETKIAFEFQYFMGATVSTAEVDMSRAASDTVRLLRPQFKYWLAQKGRIALAVKTLV